MTTTTIKTQSGSVQFEFSENMTPEDLMREIAAEFDVPSKIWSPGDMSEYVCWYPKDRRAELTDAAQCTNSWRMLEECTETDWMLVQNAVEAAADELGLESLSEEEVEAEDALNDN